MEHRCAIAPFHGDFDVAIAADAPHRAGPRAFHVAAQPHACRNGSRRHEVMAVISRTLTDDDIDNLAAWYAAIRIEAHPPGK